MHTELPSINLQSSGIDFSRFRYDLVTYFLKYANGGCNLKHVAGQTKDHQSVAHHTINAIWADPLKDLQYVTKIMHDERTIVKESDYTEYNLDLIAHSPYLIECFKLLEDFANLKFGRIRLIPLSTGVVQEHTDFGTARYHIPIVTGTSICFAVNDTLYSMPNYDHLYKLNCSVPHIAINAGTLTRLHLLLVPATDNTTIDNEDKMNERYEQSKQTAREVIANADSVCRLFNEKYFNELDHLI